ncbi:centrosomal protein of 104 kDa-like isoform X3 [Montipora foliosa]|uniref:centrosomal protein of 104 kDa-like isoform X3 n=1 Tax=Montipora foliosa TaxID=591990 RepID=UPI0035F1355C
MSCSTACKKTSSAGSLLEGGVQELLTLNGFLDPETAALIRKLDDKKREAVQSERYDYAKKLTAVTSDLYKVGEKLGRYEVEKNKAVEVKDYDLATEKKRKSEEFRLYVYKQLDIQELLELNGRHSREHRPINITPPPLPPIVTDHSREPPPPHHVEKHARPPPPLAPIRAGHLPREDTPPVIIPKRDDVADDRPLPTLNNKRPPESEVEVESPKETALNSDGPEPFKENDLRTASLIIEVFGEDLVQHAYSKQWKHRQAALENVEKEMTADTPELTADKDAKTVVKATCQLIQKGIKDQVFSVFNASLEVLRSLVKTYIPRNKIVKSEISHVADKVTPLLLTKSSEMAARSRDAATAMVLELAVHKDIKPLGVIPDYATRPFKGKQQIAASMYKSSLEIVEKLLGVLELDSDKNGSLSTENIMRVVLPALEHTSGEVRDSASRLVLELYKMVKDTVRDFLQPDEPATRKNPLYRSLFDGFDKIDGKPTEAEIRAQAKAVAANSEKAKQAEIAAPRAQLQALQDMAGCLFTANTNQAVFICGKAPNPDRNAFSNQRNDEFKEGFVMATTGRTKVYLLGLCR